MAERWVKATVMEKNADGSYSVQKTSYINVCSFLTIDPYTTSSGEVFAHLQRDGEEFYCQEAATLFLPDGHPDKV